MRLIDADQFGVVSFQGKSEDFSEGVAFILEKIDEAPTVEDRPHGEWIKKDTYFGKCWATCSVCKKISDGTGQDNGFGHDYSYPNFCPNCGADMREGEASDTTSNNR